MWRVLLAVLQTSPPSEPGRQGIGGEGDTGRGSKLVYVHVYGGLAAS